MLYMYYLTLNTIKNNFLCYK